MRRDGQSGSGLGARDPREGVLGESLGGDRELGRDHALSRIFGGFAICSGESGLGRAGDRASREVAAALLDEIYRPAFLSPPGREPYALYAVLAESLGGSALDLGTCGGGSALALALGGAEVESWDLSLRLVSPGVAAHPRIKVRQGDAVAALSDIPLGDVRLIVLDLDPHDGDQEQAVASTLARRGWAGTLVCDDIHLNPAMERFWRDAPGPKRDLTKIGHFTGTGLILFSGGEVRT